MGEKMLLIGDEGYEVTGVAFGGNGFFFAF
jgi:hypothetical protein